MEIKIVATENEENQLNELVDYLQKCGLKVIRQAGGNMPNFIGYFASISGKYSERQSSTEISKQPDSKALHKADVDNLICNHPGMLKGGTEPFYCWKCKKTIL